MSRELLVPSPSQAKVVDALVTYWPHANVLGVHGEAGFGKTTILRNLHDRFGGALVGVKELIDASRSRHPLALDDVRAAGDGCVDAARLRVRR